MSNEMMSMMSNESNELASSDSKEEHFDDVGRHYNLLFVVVVLTKTYYAISPELIFQQM